MQFGRARSIPEHLLGPTSSQRQYIIDNGSPQTTDLAGWATPSVLALLLSGIHLGARRLPTRTELLLEDVERDHVAGVWLDFSWGGQEARVVHAVLREQLFIQPRFQFGGDPLWDGRFLERIVRLRGPPCVRTELSCL